MEAKTQIQRIDVHCHAFPEVVLRKFAAEYPQSFRLEQRRDSGALVAIWAGVPLPAWTLEERLAAIERDQVAWRFCPRQPRYMRRLMATPLPSVRR